MERGGWGAGKAADSAKHKSILYKECKSHNGELDTSGYNDDPKRCIHEMIVIYLRQRVAQL